MKFKEHGNCDTLEQHEERRRDGYCHVALQDVDEEEEEKEPEGAEAESWEAAFDRVSDILEFVIEQLDPAVLRQLRQDKSSGKSLDEFCVDLAEVKLAARHQARKEAEVRKVRAAVLKKLTPNERKILGL